jgi:N-acetylglucosamine-6-sulfatase
MIALFLIAANIASATGFEKVLYSEDAYNDFRPVANPGTSSGRLIPITQNQRPPNIIVVLSDDQPRGLMGFEQPNNPKAPRTPNLDKLARSGVVLDRFYVPIGQCGPSRATLWTGLLPHQHKVITNNLALSTKYKTLPDYLHEAGYYSGFIGKCHLAPKNEVGRHARGFDRFIWTDNMGKEMMNPLLNDAFKGPIQFKNKHVTEVLTDLSLQFLADAKGQNKPFFLWYSHRAPHANASMYENNQPNLPPAQASGEERYPRSWIDDLPSLTPGLAYDPKNQPEALDPLRLASAYAQASPSRKLVYKLGRRVVQDELHSTYSHMHHIDEQFGRLIAKLQELGELENTIILYLSDNGRFLGERGMLRKGPFFFDEIIRIPGILYYPKELPPHKNPSLLYSTDIMPTLLEGAGYKLESDIVGKSFWSVLKDQKNFHRESIYLTYNSQIVDPKNFKTPMRGVLWSQYKWTQYRATTYYSKDPKTLGSQKYDGLDFELYDLKNDPLEVNNLLARLGPNDNALARQMSVGSPLRPVLMQLRRVRAQWQNETQEPLAPEISKFAVNNSSKHATIQWQTAQPTTAEILVYLPNDLKEPVEVIEVPDFKKKHLVDVPLATLNGRQSVLYVYEVDGNGNRQIISLPRKP